MSLVDIKNRARRAIHNRLAVPVDVIDSAHPTGLILPLTGPKLTARYHTKLDRTGGLDDDYAQIIDGIDRLVFLDANVAEVSAALVANMESALVLAAKTVIIIPGYKAMRFKLDNREPPDGPAETAWTVARVRD